MARTRKYPRLRPTVAPAKKRKVSGPKNWEALLTTLANLRGQNAHIRKKAIDYTVSSTAITVPAHSDITGLSQLQHARWDAVTPLQRPISLRYEAEKAFFAQNLIFVRSLADMRPDITRRFLPEVKKLWVNMPADLNTVYRQRAVNSLHGAISTALADCPELELLVLAITYKDVKGRKRAARGTEWSELRVIVGALRLLDASKKLVLICQVDDHVEKREELKTGEVREGRSVEWMLARAEVGVAFEV